MPTIILEDLGEAGYSMCNSLFEYDDVKIIVERLAQFHATSMYLNEV